LVLKAVIHNLQRLLHLLVAVLVVLLMVEHQLVLAVTVVQVAVAQEVLAQGLVEQEHQDKVMLVEAHLIRHLITELVVAVVFLLLERLELERLAAMVAQEQILIQLGLLQLV
jgi:hypothetical protein